MVQRNLALKKANEELHKRNPNAVSFCKDCNLRERIYCSKCARTQINKLDKLSMGIIEEEIPLIKNEESGEVVSATNLSTSSFLEN